MAMVELNDQEWQQVLAIIGDAPWRVANPLLMKIGEQLRAQLRPAEKQSAPPGGGVRIDLGDSGNAAAKTN